MWRMSVFQIEKGGRGEMGGGRQGTGRTRNREEKTRKGGRGQRPALLMIPQAFYLSKQKKKNGGKEDKAPAERVSAVSAWTRATNLRAVRERQEKKVGRGNATKQKKKSKKKKKTIPRRKNSSSRFGAGRRRVKQIGGKLIKG